MDLNLYKVIKHAILNHFEQGILKKFKNPSGYPYKNLGNIVNTIQLVSILTSVSLILLLNFSFIYVDIFSLWRHNIWLITSICVKTWEFRFKFSSVPLNLVKSAVFKLNIYKLNNLILKFLTENCENSTKIWKTELKMQRVKIGIPRNPEFFSSNSESGLFLSEFWKKCLFFRQNPRKNLNSEYFFQKTFLDHDVNDANDTDRTEMVLEQFNWTLCW